METKPRFPLFHSALGNRKLRDSHIPTAPTTPSYTDQKPATLVPYGLESQAHFPLE